MYREIKKKRLILENRKPYSQETAVYIREMNAVDLACSSIRMDGMTTSRQNVERIVRGEFVVECSIREHVAVRSHCDALRDSYEMAAMNMALNERAILRLYKTLTGGESQGYRRNNPVLRSLDYIPPHFNEVDEQMMMLYQWMATDDVDMDPIRRAACLHNKFIEIYPFQDASESMARLVMQYELIRNNFPPVPLLMSEQEYNEAIIRYLKTEKSDALYDALMRGLFSKLELFMQLTAC